ncbi:MAG TPA: DUF3617 family protein, partial [Ktedonobacterales bacterium]|nr:DUF3617 family protein [Ktedonobacterales bacterium]
MTRQRGFPDLRLAGLALLSATVCRIVVAGPPTSPTPPPPSAAVPSPVTSAPEAELPSLKPGMWEYQRTLTTRARGTPAQAKVSKCSDPTLEMRNKLAELEKKGCRFSPTVHLGNTYRASWTCPTHGGVVAMSQKLTVTSDSSYEDISEARFKE